MTPLYTAALFTKHVQVHISRCPRHPYFGGVLYKFPQKRARSPWDDLHDTISTGRSPRDDLRGTISTGRFPRDDLHGTMSTGQCSPRTTDTSRAHNDFGVLAPCFLSPCTGEVVLDLKMVKSEVEQGGSTWANKSSESLFCGREPLRFLSPIKSHYS